MKLITKSLSLDSLQTMAANSFGNLVKAVVDVDKGIMVVDAELHADEEQHLLAKGSKQEHLWGINFYPELYGQDDFIEFDSMINIRPNHNNMTRGIDDIKTKNTVIKIVKHLVTHKNAA